MKHLDSRSDFATDEAFANFRALILNNKPSDYFYRSASAITNYYGRAATVRKIMAEKGITQILDSSSIRCACESDEFGREFVKRLRSLLDQSGPFIIQCDSGKKRTGFVCIILEALSGTNYYGIVRDYLESYENNNGLNFKNNPGNIAQIISQKINPHIRFVAASNLDISRIRLQDAAKKYLARYGLTSSEIAQLQSALLK